MTKNTRYDRARNLIRGLKRLPILSQDLDLNRTRRILTDPTPDAEDLADVEDELHMVADELEMLAEDIRKYCFNDLQTMIREATK